MHLDFETYSEAGYRWEEGGCRWRPSNPSKPGLGVGAWIYTAHPSADIISLDYDGTMWIPGMPPPLDLFEYIKSGGVLWAHNSFFEYSVWTNIAVRRYGWPVVPLEQFRCTQALALAWGLPSRLKDIGAALNLSIQKDPAGNALIRKLTVPRTPTKNNPLRRLTPESNPEDFGRLYEYNMQDVRAEQELSRVLPPLPPQEEALWLLDQRINARGVHIDRAALENCVEIVHQATDKYTLELQLLTGGVVGSANELQSMTGWLRSQGVSTVSLDAAAVASLLGSPLPADAHRVLEIRQILGSASVKKLFSIQHYLAEDDRVRGLFQYCGAERTGRFAGRGPQPQNMPSGGPVDEWDAEGVEKALADIATGDLSVVELAWGDPLTTVSGCLRGLFTAAPGHDLIASDYSAIEAVVLAALAGEEWRMEVFRTHGKIYEMSASKISGVPFEEFLEYKRTTGQHHPLRKKIGKVAELASGYMGWIGAWKAFGADKFMTDEEIKKNILIWRGASPAIPEFWGGQNRKVEGRWEFYPEYYGLEGAAVMAVLNPGKFYSYRSITYGVKAGVLYCRLPSGRLLSYHSPGLQESTDPRGQRVLQLSFMGRNPRVKKWERTETYGGKLTENVVQATARDILTDAMLRLEAAGYPIVLHVHDEICCEVPQGWGSVEEMERIMGDMPAWCADWPIRASGGWRGKRYRK